MNDLVTRASKFAAEEHGRIGQLRKYTNDDYIVHPIEVRDLVAAAGLDEETQAAAALHDTMEDCGTQKQEIARRFGDRVADMVASLTDVPAQKGLNREQRKALDRARLAAADGDTQSIKCADMLDNTKSIAEHDPDFAKTYLPEKRACLEILTKAHPDILAAAWRSLRAAEEKVFGPLATLVE
jgi:(p)ppGpp synthase/HD superfamily hydrolase